MRIWSKIRAIFVLGGNSMWWAVKFFFFIFGLFLFNLVVARYVYILVGLGLIYIYPWTNNKCSLLYESVLRDAMAIAEDVN